MAERFKLPLVVTASSWSNLFASEREAAKRARGAAELGFESVPRLTNREALALITAFRAVAPMTSEGFALWYQFAAVAYGWDPMRDRFDLSSAQRDKLYPIEATKELWDALQRIALAMDDERSEPARIELDDSDFADVLVQGDTRKALIDDGATVAFKIPLPACKDPKTGKPTGKPHKNPQTGKWECDVVTIDDPITAIIKSLTKVAVPLGLIAIAIAVARKQKRTPTRQRRSRRLTYGART